MFWQMRVPKSYIGTGKPLGNIRLVMPRRKATRYTNNPPPLPENDDDGWFKWHPKLPGSGKAPRKQLQPKTLKKKGRAKGGVKKLPPDQQPKKKPRKY